MRVKNFIIASIVIIVMFLAIYRIYEVNKAYPLVGSKSETLLFHDLSYLNKVQRVRDLMTKYPLKSSIDSSDFILNELYMISNKRWDNEFTNGAIVAQYDSTEQINLIQISRKMDVDYKLIQNATYSNAPKSIMISMELDSLGDLDSFYFTLTTKNSSIDLPQNFSLRSKINLSYYTKEKSELYTEFEKPSIKTSKKEETLFKFKSYSMDYESKGEIVESNEEITYHTFDFENLQITQRSRSFSTGQWKTVKIPMKSFYLDGVTYVIRTDYKGISKVWFSPIINNLGYDFYNGDRWAYYDIERLE